jgi:hypothetical protein
LRFTHVEFFLLRVLIPYAPVVGVLNFFLLVLPSSVPQRGVYLICYPLQGSCGVDYFFSFLSDVVGVPALCWDMGALLQSQWGALGLCTLWGVGLLAPTLPLNGGARIPALGQERLGSTEGRHSVKHWMSVYLVKQGYWYHLQSSRL